MCRVRFSGLAWSFAAWSFAAWPFATWPFATWHFYILAFSTCPLSKILNSTVFSKKKQILNIK